VVFIILFIVVLTLLPIIITGWTLFDVFKHIPSVPGR
jgi:hypothetical protein